MARLGTGLVGPKEFASFEEYFYVGLLTIQTPKVHAKQALREDGRPGREEWKAAEKILYCILSILASGIWYIWHFVYLVYLYLVYLAFVQLCSFGFG